jgi:hypothetical protein
VSYTIHLPKPVEMASASLRKTTGKSRTIGLFSCAHTTVNLGRKDPMPTEQRGPWSIGHGFLYTPLPTYITFLPGSASESQYLRITAQGKRSSLRVACFFAPSHASVSLVEISVGFPTVFFRHGGNATFSTRRHCWTRQICS